MKRPTSKDIAREARVSQTTVSRVLNDHPGITPETRERVFAAIKLLNYSRDEVARSLITRRTRTIGVVVSDITNPFYPELVNTLTEGLTAAGYRMLLWDIQGDDNPQLLHTVSQRFVDGMIFTAATSTAKEVLMALSNAYPIVLLNRYVDGVPCDVAVTDNESGAASVAEHLVSLGHRQIGVIAGPSHASTARDRAASFVNRLHEFNLDVAAEHVEPGTFSYESGFRSMEALVHRCPGITAVFAVNDAMAIGALNAAMNLGIEVPEEVSVVGFDDIPMASWPAFRLTTVRQPIAALARWGIDRVLERVGDPSLPYIRHLFPSELIIRATTGPATGVEAREERPA